MFECIFTKYKWKPGKEGDATDSRMSELICNEIGLNENQYMDNQCDENGEFYEVPDNDYSMYS